MVQIPASTSKVLSDIIPTKWSGRSWSWKNVVVTPACGAAQVNSKSLNLTIEGVSKENPWTPVVVTVIIPAIWS